MSTEDTATQEQAPMDSAMQMFYESLPDAEKAGESPAAPAEGGVPTKAEESAQSEAETAAVADTGKAETPTEKPAADTGEATKGSTDFNLNKYLEESSEGLLKTEDDFKGAISKIKDFDALSQKVKALEAEKETIFADDFVKTLNALRKEGRSQEQIDNYINLSKVDLAKIDPKEALIQDQILNHNHTRAIAERIVSKKYGLDKLSIDDDTLSPQEIESNKAELETIQAIMSNDAKPIVEEIKSKVEGFQNSVSPEQKALDEAARKKSYEKALEPFADQLVKDFPKAIPLKLEDGVELTYEMPEEFTATIRQEAIEYFNHPDMQVNSETVQEFATLKKALFVYSKLKDIMTHTYEQGKAIGVKEAKSEFENLGGVNRPDADVQVTAENIDEALMAIAKN